MRLPKNFTSTMFVHCNQLVDGTNELRFQIICFWATRSAGAEPLHAGISKGEFFYRRIKDAAPLFSPVDWNVLQKVLQSEGG
jgi:hypothetical protein